MFVIAGEIKVHTGFKSSESHRIVEFSFQDPEDMELESGSYVVIEEDLLHYFLEESKTRNIWIERLFSCYFTDKFLIIGQKILAKGLGKLKNHLFYRVGTEEKKINFKEQNFLCYAAT